MCRMFLPIIWRVDGKVKEIKRTLTSERKNIIFDYNAMGQRIAKHVYDNQTGLLEKSTYYILDAQGNQMSMYEHNVGDTSATFTLEERNIYGSSRLGVLNDSVDMFNPEPLPSYGVLGNRSYELTNHLGNVLAVVSDNYFTVEAGSHILEYRAGLNQVYDYSPFGVQLKDRTLEPEAQEITETAYVQTDEMIYASNFNINQSQLSNYNGWYANAGTSALFIEASGGNNRLKVVSSNTNSGANRNFTGLVANEYYRISFDLDKNTTPDVQLKVLGIVGGSQTTLYTGTYNTNGTHTVEFFSNATEIRVQLLGQGTFYIDNFYLEYKVSLSIDFANFEFPAMVVQPNINGWTFDPSNTLAWGENDRLNAKRGPLKYTFTSASFANFTTTPASVKVYPGSNDMTIKLTTTPFVGNPPSPQYFYVSAGSGLTTVNFNLPSKLSALSLLVEVIPSGNDEYYIDDF